MAAAKLARALALVAVLAVSCAEKQGGGGAADPTPNAPTGTAVDVSGLDAGGRELAILLERMASIEFHARYKSQAQSAAAANRGEVGLELWSRPPSFRRDATIRRGGDEVHTIEIDDGREIVGCFKRTPGSEFRCARGRAGQDLTGGSVFDAVLEGVRGRTVTPRDDTYNGRRARCFSVETRPATATSAPTTPAATSPSQPSPPEAVCFTPEGIPLVIDSGELAIVMIFLETTVDEDAFEPPVQPTG